MRISSQVEGTWESDAADEPVIVNGCTFRLPTSRDLAWQRAKPIHGRRGADRQSCLRNRVRSLNGPRKSYPRSATSWPLADPLAEIWVSVPCPACGYDGKETLDLVSFLWAEIEARVRRVLFEIHALASVYAWSEADILSLSENRRSMYLEMVQA